jgi:arsenite methyltransferase
MAMVAIAGFTKDQIFSAVREMYSEVANLPSKQFHFPTGRSACLFVGYPEDLLDRLPASAVESFAGVGFPFRADLIRAGDRVLDIGAGSGTDTLIAARAVAPGGRVFALDMTLAMLAKLRKNVALAGAANVEVVEGNAESVPLPDASVDVVTSNGVLNLVPDKAKAFAEIFRVLRPGGRVQIADIVVGRPVGEDARGDPKLWAECVVGVLPGGGLRRALSVGRIRQRGHPAPVRLLCWERQHRHQARGAFAGGNGSGAKNLQVNSPQRPMPGRSLQLSNVFPPP